MIKKLSRLIFNELSKIALIRSNSKFLTNWHEINIKPYPQRQEFLGGHPSRLIKNFQMKFFVWQSAPTHFSGGLILNLLGFHVIRHIFHNKLKTTRAISSKFSDLNEAGVKTVNAFLNSQDLDYIRSFYERNIDRSFIYLPDFSELVIYSNIMSVSNSNYDLPEFRELRKFLVDKLDLDNLFSEFSGKKLKAHPFISILHHKSFIDKNYTAQEDGNNIPHRDVFYPSYKIFIYLNDVSEDNAAFVYYPNTHAANDVSLKEVYSKSLRYYLHDKRALKPVNELDNFKNPSLPVSQVGPAGTAVFFNVAGIHKRGDYKKDRFRERIVLLIDFRQNDALVVPKEHHWKR